MLRVNAARLWKTIMESAKIGATPAGGINRQALTDNDASCRRLFISWCEAAGCSIAVDSVGNVFARYEGTRPDLSPVVTGSHLDTQPTGGKFDGIFGVLAGLEVIRTLHDQGIRTLRPIEVAVWTNEEGARFSPPMLGSGAFTGEFTEDFVLTRQDADGVALDDELHRIGFKGAEKTGDHPIFAYLEAHIEQGPILEHAERTIGVVMAAQGQRWFEVDVIGQEAHAGPTPMEMRKDALVGAARMIQKINALGNSRPPYSRSTCGMISVEPASRNVIPGKSWFTADIRHPDEEVLATMEAAFRDIVREVAEEGGFAYEIREFWSFPSTAFDSACIADIRAAVDGLGYTHMDIVSGAGHDAVYIARIAPTAMIFIPCEKGISHNEIEHASKEATEAGANVLLHAIMAQADRAA